LEKPSGFGVFQMINPDKSPIPVPAQSKAWVCGRSLIVIAGSNPAGVMDICLSVYRECCVVSSRVLCVRLITRPEQSYRVWCV
jgi:hypothetical protein